MKELKKLGQVLSKNQLKRVFGQTGDPTFGSNCFASQFNCQASCYTDGGGFGICERGCTVVNFGSQLIIGYSCKLITPF